MLLSHFVERETLLHKNHILQHHTLILFQFKDVLWQDPCHGESSRRLPLHRTLSIHLSPLITPHRALWSHILTSRPTINTILFLRLSPSFIRSRRYPLHPRLYSPSRDAVYSCWRNTRIRRRSSSAQYRAHFTEAWCSDKASEGQSGVGRAVRGV